MGPLVLLQLLRLRGEPALPHPCWQQLELRQAAAVLQEELLELLGPPEPPQKRQEQQEQQQREQRGQALTAAAAPARAGRQPSE